MLLPEVASLVHHAHVSKCGTFVRQLFGYTSCCLTCQLARALTWLPIRRSAYVSWATKQDLESRSRNSKKGNSGKSAFCHM